MKNIVLYTNNEAVNYELRCLEKTKADLIVIREFLINNSVEPTAQNIIAATKKSFSNHIKSIKDVEVKKTLKIIDTLGDSVLTEGWEKRVDDKVGVINNNLINSCPGWYFQNDEYIKYFDFENGVNVKPEFNREFFENKNSLILSTEKEIEFYEKHCQAVELLNELMNHPENEYIRLNTLFFFDPINKQFELNIATYDNEFEKFDFVKKREQEKKDDEYNKRMGEHYRNSLSKTDFL